MVRQLQRGCFIRQHNLLVTAGAHGPACPSIYPMQGSAPVLWFFAPSVNTVDSCVVGSMKVSGSKGEPYPTRRGRRGALIFCNHSFCFPGSAPPAWVVGVPRLQVPKAGIILS